MSNKTHQNADVHHTWIYQIRVKGHVSHNWSDWFGGLSISQQEDGETLLTGTVIDQAALYGLLRRVGDLGLPLLSVIRVEPEQINRSESKPTQE